MCLDEEKPDPNARQPLATPRLHHGHRRRTVGARRRPRLRLANDLAAGRGRGRCLATRPQAHARPLPPATPPTAGREQMTLRVLVTAAVALALSTACRRRCVCV